MDTKQSIHSIFICEIQIIYDSTAFQEKKCNFWQKSLTLHTDWFRLNCFWCQTLSQSFGLRCLLCSQTSELSWKLGVKYSWAVKPVRNGCQDDKCFWQSAWPLLWSKSRAFNREIEQCCNDMISTSSADSGLSLAGGYPSQAAQPAELPCHPVEKCFSAPLKQIKCIWPVSDKLH